jgi:hypothetical protein
MRLARRGVELTALLAAASVAEQTASALPAALMMKTTEAAMSGTISASVSALVEGMASAAFASKIKMAALFLLTASLLTGAGLWARYGRNIVAVLPVASPDAPEKAKPQKPLRDTPATVQVGGRVVDPDGKPVRGAKLLVVFAHLKETPNKIWATSAADDRFQFTMPKRLEDDHRGQSSDKHPYVLAAAEGYGFALASLDKPEAATDLTLRLVKDDVPIRGRVLNLEGKPVAGVRVRVNDFEPLYIPQLYVPKKGDLTDWLVALKTNKMHRGTPRAIS